MSALIFEMRFWNCLCIPSKKKILWTCKNQFSIVVKVLAKNQGIVSSRPPLGRKESWVSVGQIFSLGQDYQTGLLLQENRRQGMFATLIHI